MTKYHKAGYLLVIIGYKNYQEIIGITSGASTPDILVESAIKHIKNIFGNDDIAVENYDALPENMNFSLPRELNKTIK